MKAPRLPSQNEPFRLGPPPLEPHPAEPARHAEREPKQHRKAELEAGAGHGGVAWPNHVGGLHLADWQETFGIHPNASILSAVRTISRSRLGSTIPPMSSSLYPLAGIAARQVGIATVAFLSFVRQFPLGWWGTFIQQSAFGLTAAECEHTMPARTERVGISSFELVMMTGCGAGSFPYSSGTSVQTIRP